MAASYSGPISAEAGRRLERLSGWCSRGGRRCRWQWRTSWAAATPAPRLTSEASPSFPGSVAPRVADQLLFIHEQCLQSNYSPIEKLKNSHVQGNDVSQSRQGWAAARRWRRPGGGGDLKRRSSGGCCCGEAAARVGRRPGDGGGQEVAARIIAPVQLDGRWSCYFWDFVQRKIHILDPTMMNKTTIEVQRRHSAIASLLHCAVAKCKDKWYIGWDAKMASWTRWYQTNIGPLCCRSNSGFFVMHYARAYDGAGLEWYLKTGDHGLNQAEMMYQLLSMAGNSVDMTCQACCCGCLAYENNLWAHLVLLKYFGQGR